MMAQPGRSSRKRDQTPCFLALGNGHNYITPQVLPLDQDSHARKILIKRSQEGFLIQQNQSQPSSQPQVIAQQMLFQKISVYLPQKWIFEMTGAPYILETLQRVHIYSCSDKLFPQHSRDGDCQSKPMRHKRRLVLPIQDLGGKFAN